MRVPRIRWPLVGCATAALAVSGAVGAAPAAAADRASSGPRIVALDAAAAVPGAAIVVRGRGLGAKGVVATFGGRRATVLARSSRRLALVVPRVTPGLRRLVVRRGSRRASRSFTVLRPFSGRVRARVDAARASTSRLGPAGGTVAATASNGVRYVLNLPPGALTREESIVVVPVRRFTGLPFSGGRTAGVRLLPDGLVLARRATLTITRSGAFSPRSVGFSASAKQGFEIGDATVQRAGVAVPVDHFSDHGAAEARAVDFANLVDPIVRRLGPLSLSGIRTILGLMAVWDERFSPRESVDRRPPSFCAAQPVCRRVIDKVDSSIGVLVAQQCALGKRLPGLGVLGALVDLRASRELLGLPGDPAEPCIQSTGIAVMTGALEALAKNPLTYITDADLLPPGRTDLNGDGRITAWEFVLRLDGEFALLGIEGAEALNQALPGALDKIRTDGLARCATDRPGGARDLREGLAYVSATGGSPEAFFAALAACGVGVLVSPAAVELAPGATQQFTATITDVDRDRIDGEGVTWTASRGSITPAGLYTAPATAGPAVVRATSRLNPERFAEAAVTVTQPAAVCAAPSARVARRSSTARVVQEGDVVLDSQAAVDAFAAGGITEIGGNLQIGSFVPGDDPVVDVSRLAGLAKVGGGLTIVGAEVRGLAGLEKLTTARQLAVFGNPQLATLDGLCGLQAADGIAISGNAALTSLRGLAGVGAVSGSLSVSANAALTSLEGLDGVTLVGNELRADGPALASVDGLRNVASVGTILTVETGPRAGTMQTWSLAGLEQVGSRIQISGDGGTVRTLSLPALTRIGQFGISLNGSDLTAVSAPALTRLGQIAVFGTDEALAFTLAPTAQTELPDIGDVTVSGGRGGSVSLSLARVGRDLIVSDNQRTAVNIDVTGVARDYRFTGNCAVAPGGVRVGSVGRDTDVLSNSGFDDAAGLAYAEGIPTTRTRRVSGNVQPVAC